MLLIDEMDYMQFINSTIDKLKYTIIERCFGEAAIDYIGIYKERIMYTLLNFETKNELVCYDIISQKKQEIPYDPDDIKIFLYKNKVYYNDPHQYHMQELSGNTTIEFLKNSGLVIGIFENYIITNKIVDYKSYILIYDISAKKICKKLKGFGHLFDEMGILVIY